jgi:hypothetical protein
MSRLASSFILEVDWSSRNQEGKVYGRQGISTMYIRGSLLNELFHAHEKWPKARCFRIRLSHNLDRKPWFEWELQPVKCPKCGDTGVLVTGNNDLPCDCPQGDIALFNEAGIGCVTGAEIKRHFLNTSPEPIDTLEELNEKRCQNTNSTEN